ncbi:Etoposide-induced protein 2.4 protein [Fasciola gigantica]|uniref:Etoposide-induced protein 2.4 protein n=1 Tax=Fasciola gigantica TaxID=46835 RepID=A0A504Z427_FASGI|nr:Etoposide-induced protein 2.4 protein [Fasciola gigantica]
MSSGHGFFAGLGDFLAAPTRLWRMHRRLIALNPKARALEQVQHHQEERARRFQLRTRMMMDFYTAKPTLSLSPSPQHTTLTDSGGLFQPLVRMWLINVGLILLLALLSSMVTLIASTNRVASWMLTSGTFRIVSLVISCILHICLPLFMELVNMLYLKKICDRIALLKSKSSRESFATSQTEQQSFGGTIMDRLYALIFFVLFQLQWSLISMLTSSYKLSNVINVFAVAYMYACYAIEYRWRQVPGRTFEGFLAYIVECWTYFVGYGFILGLCSLFFPHFIGWGGMLLSITYPILVIGALGAPQQQQKPQKQSPQHTSSSTSSASQLNWLERQLNWLFRFPLVWSMRPALILTNWIVRACVALAYQMWF